MKALLIVDVQNDFVSGGSLAVEDAEQVIPTINKVMDYFDLVMASKDWHPAESEHFKKWPVHCVSESKGADFHPDLHQDKINQVFYKGTGKKDDGYSAFEATNMNFLSFLKDKGVKDLYICGIALEFCVKSSALDAIKGGLNVYLIRDAIATFSKDSKEIEAEYDKMKNEGATIVLSKQIID
ncbi:MAG: isochorismatase family protein [Candidatus Atribacteria bacterium]|nr:isochorismatase family protein [Candidatus Atribacteria bacterium]